MLSSAVANWVVILAATCAGQASPASSRESVRAAVKAADLILNQQDSSGAICMGPISQKENRIVSYFSCFAAHGLVDVYKQTKQKKYLEGAKRWADWYFANQNEDGTIYDYFWAGTDWTTKKELDSTDSYAAVYIDLLKAIYTATNDLGWLRERQPFLVKTYNAMNMTRQSNGLTTAKPGYPVMFTMDNVEVLSGLRSAAYLFGVLRDKERSTRAAKLAKETEKAIDTLLWNENAKCYRVGIQTDGGKLEGLSEWYPDVMANLMAVAWLPRSVRNVSLYARLSSKFREIAPEKAANLDDVEHLVWWGWASAGIDNKTALANIQGKLIGFDRFAKGGCDPGLLGHIARLCCIDASR